MTGSRVRGFTRPACLAVAFTLGAPQYGLGSDGSLQAALLEAGCPSYRLEKLFDRDGMTAYRANCFGSAHKLVIVNCIKGVCVPSGAREGQRE